MLNSFTNFKSVYKYTIFKYTIIFILWYILTLTGEEYSHWRHLNIFGRPGSRFMTLACPEKFSGGFSLSGLQIRKYMISQSPYKYMEVINRNNHYCLKNKSGSWHTFCRQFFEMCVYTALPELTFHFIQNLRVSKNNMVKEWRCDVVMYLPVKVFNVTFESSFRPARIVTLRALMLEMTVHMSIEMVFGVPCKKIYNLYIIV